MKYIALIVLATSLAGCVTAPVGHYGGGYYPPSSNYTRSYTEPRPHNRAQKVCAWEDHYSHRARTWVRQERCYWR
jgi:hypothetical protein